MNARLRYRCPLGRLVAEPRDVERAKREGWRDLGILVVAADDPRLDWVEHEFVQRIGERLYGRRGHRHG